jgi:hypothetical protein
MARGTMQEHNGRTVAFVDASRATAFDLQKLRFGEGS